MIEAGADLVDIGGESTRPGAEPVGARRGAPPRAPGLERLAGLPISVDTSKRRGRAPGDRARGSDGQRRDSAATRARARRGRRGCRCDLCLMHMQGEPRTMQVAPRTTTSCRRSPRSSRSGFVSRSSPVSPRSAICLDPGIGFGKTPDQNLELLRRLDGIVALGRPVLVGRLPQEHACARHRRARTTASGPTPPLSARRWPPSTAARRSSASMTCARTSTRCGRGRGRAGDRLAVTIELQGIVLHGYHGVLEHERRDGQRFLVDVELDLADECRGNERRDRGRRGLPGRRRAVARGLGRARLQSARGVRRGARRRAASRFPVSRVRVRVRKPDVVLDPPVEYAAVVVERARLGGDPCRREAQAE